MPDGSDAPRGKPRTWWRFRRRLGLPRLSRRGWLWLAAALVALILAATALGELFLSAGRYGPQHYEPKDFSREEQVEREMKAKPATQP